MNWLKISPLSSESRFVPHISRVVTKKRCFCLPSQSAQMKRISALNQSVKTTNVFWSPLDLHAVHWVNFEDDRDRQDHVEPVNQDRKWDGTTHRNCLTKNYNYNFVRLALREWYCLLAVLDGYVVLESNVKMKHLQTEWYFENMKTRSSNQSQKLIINKSVC